MWGCTEQNSAAAVLQLPPKPAGGQRYLQLVAPSLPSPRPPLLVKTAKLVTVVAAAGKEDLSGAWTHLQCLHYY